MSFSVSQRLFGQEYNQPNVANFDPTPALIHTGFTSVRTLKQGHIADATAGGGTIVALKAFATDSNGKGPQEVAGCLYEE